MNRLPRIYTTGATTAARDFETEGFALVLECRWFVIELQLCKVVRTFAEEAPDAR